MSQISVFVQLLNVIIDIILSFANTSIKEMRHFCFTFAQLGKKLPPSFTEPVRMEETASRNEE
jgi:hypothetical protein